MIRMIRIAIDFDGTFTTDPPTWSYLMGVLDSADGFLVCVVSCRQDTEENRQLMQELIPGRHVVAYLTSGVAKKFYMDELGLPVDIWIDDDPATILNGI